MHERLDRHQLLIFGAREAPSTGGPPWTAGPRHFVGLTPAKSAKLPLPLRRYQLPERLTGGCVAGY